VIPVYIGVDERQPIAFSTLAASIWRHSSQPVQITPLHLPQLPITRRGLTAFTFSRWLVPYLCGYKGSAIFLDADMVVTGDIAELYALASYNHDVQVVKDQEPFEWASMMIFNCARCRPLTPEFIEDKANNPFDFKWAKSVGDLPGEWNHNVHYSDANMEAKLHHFTAGVPIWAETRGRPEDAIWLREARFAGGTCSYQELMGKSIHHARRANQ
jgi:lipopolysaccharide biosynthesis glycosyltransferase